MTDKNKDVVERYTVRDAQNYKLGRFVFDKGILELKTQEDADEFADLLSGAAVMVTRAIRRTDLTQARAIVAAHIAKGSIAHQGGADSLTNRAQPNVPDLNKANEALDLIPEGSMDDPVLTPDVDADDNPHKHPEGCVELTPELTGSAEAGVGGNGKAPSFSIKK